LDFLQPSISSHPVSPWRHSALPHYSPGQTICFRRYPASQDVGTLLERQRTAEDGRARAQPGGGGSAAHAATAAPHPRWARINTLKLSVEEALARLRADRRTAAAKVCKGPPLRGPVCAGQALRAATRPAGCARTTAVRSRNSPFGSPACSPAAEQSSLRTCQAAHSQAHHSSSLTACQPLLTRSSHTATTTATAARWTACCPTSYGCHLAQTCTTTRW
jgi:hypothetical protein